jgi:putative alpha-1,2-mannosidase
MATNVQLLGGPEKFIERLSFLHDSGVLYIGDEQAYLAVFQFHYGGRPGLSTKQSHAYIPSAFNNTNDGLPGNDDSGAMASYVALCMMGLWPVPGQDVYLITPPYFPEVNITSGSTGKIATVRNVNFDPAFNSIYIQNATLNGKPYTKNWIAHDFYTEGGVLELVLGDTESSWGTALADLPPSLTSYKS